MLKNQQVLDLTIPLDDEKTWRLIGGGNCKGLFQLESPLGKRYAKRLKPKNIEHLSALLALIRPGCLEAIVDGKSMTEHYILRKNYLEGVDYFHEELKDILKDTYGILCYQEQSMQIAQKIAGFNLQEADKLRKSIGKKDAKLMGEIKKQFLDGCKKVKKINSEEGEEIFEWIRKSQRYSFNHSHAISYAYTTYTTAYLKAHYPNEFFASYLFHAKEKPDRHEEINELVANAQQMGIVVHKPDIRLKNSNFKLINNKIYFGLTDIKGVGQLILDSILADIKIIEDHIKKTIEKWSWTEFLVLLARKVNKRAMIGMIGAGALDWFEIDRKLMLHEYDIFSQLRTREQLWLQNELLTDPTLNVTQLLELIIKAPTGKSGGIYHTKRVGVVKSLYKCISSPIFSIKDSSDSIARNEKELLGVCLTASLVDEKDASSANCCCMDIFKSKKTKNAVVAVQIDKISEWIVKKGKKKGMPMGFLKVSDNSCVLDNVPLFPEQYEEYNHMLFEGNTVLITGDDNGRGFIINKMYEL